MPYFNELNEPISKEQALKEEFEKLQADLLEEADEVRTFDDGRQSNAINTKLQMTFTKANGDNVSMTMKHCKQDLSAANVKSLMEGIVANGSIFEKVPAAIKSAVIITTESTAVDLS